MVRELSPLITAIIVAGRSGSAYTAQIGTMKVTEEVDALRIMGIDPISWLVLPRLVAAVLVMPVLALLLSLAADLGYGIWARHKLLTQFRLAAAQRYAPRPAFWKRLLGKADPAQAQTPPVIETPA